LQTGKRKVATGPAAGDGYEIFLQGFNWESCKKDWYKVCHLLRRRVTALLLCAFYGWCDNEWPVSSGSHETPLPALSSIFVQVLLGQIQQMKEAGFTAVWLPPPSDSVSPQGYLPRDLYVFDSQYGSASDLKELLRALDDAGIKSIADVVINHRCAHKQVKNKIMIEGN
jgi:alpha-amylase